MNATLLLRVLLAIACCLVVPRAFAAEECTVSTTGVNFGTYDPTSGTAVTAQGTIEVLCRGNALNVTIAIGTGGSNSFANRRMTDGTTDLFYNLYTTAARTTIFGDYALGRKEKVAEPA